MLPLWMVYRSTLQSSAISMGHKCVLQPLLPSHPSHKLASLGHTDFHGESHFGGEWREWKDVFLDGGVGGTWNGVPLCPAWSRSPCLARPQPNGFAAVERGPGGGQKHQAALVPVSCQQRTHVTFAEMPQMKDGMKCHVVLVEHSGTTLTLECWIHFGVITSVVQSGCRRGPPTTSGTASGSKV